MTQPPKVHYIMAEREGNRYTLCERTNPQHSTRSGEWITCKACTTRLRRLGIMSGDQIAVQLTEWLKNAREKNQHGGLIVLT